MFVLQTLTGLVCCLFCRPSQDLFVVCLADRYRISCLFCRPLQDYEKLPVRMHRSHTGSSVGESATTPVTDGTETTRKHKKHKHGKEKDRKKAEKERKVTE